MGLVFRAVFNAVRLLALLVSLPAVLAARRRAPPWVKLRLEGNLTNRPVPRSPWRWRRARRRSSVGSLDELERQVRVLSNDPRVKGVVFELSELVATPARRAVLHELIGRLRQSGKQTVAYGKALSQVDYEVASACDKVVVAPYARLEITGFASEQLALAGLLEKLGIRAHFVRRGEHKTAPELFTDESISSPRRAMVEAILEDRHERLVTTIVRGRNIDAAKARSWIDHGPYAARTALELQLVDALAHPHELESLLSPDGGAAPEARRPSVLGSYARYRRGLLPPPYAFRPLRGPRVISVVPLAGIIAQGASGPSPLGALVDADEVGRRLEAAREDGTVATLLSITSPGGSAAASEQLLEAIRRLSAEKPVVAYCESVAASGGYMAALGARELWAGPGAIIGSIGVFGGKFEASGLLARLGVASEVLGRGANAGLLSGSRGFTPSERAALEREIDDTYEQFLGHVSRARQRPVEEIRRRAEGRVYTASGALEAGLIDRIGSFEGALQRALELAGAPLDRPALRWYLPRGRLPSFGRLLGALGRTQVLALCEGALSCQA